MAKQNNTTEEDYLDQLLNSVISGGDAGNSGQNDIFDTELANASNLDEEFFDAVEKEWVEQKKQESIVQPENFAKDMFEKFKDDEDGEYRDVPPEVVDFAEDVKPKEEEPTEEQSVEESEEQPEDVLEEDMQGLYDILGVEPEAENENNQEIHELENETGKKKKKKEKKEKKEKKRKSLFQKKVQNDAAIDIALDLMENQPMDETTAPPAEEVPPADMLNEEDFLNDIPDLADIEEIDKKKSKKEKKKKEKKEKEPKKDKKKKKPQKQKEKRPKKIREPKEPDEIISISVPFLIFMISICILIICSVVFGGKYYQYQNGISNATSYYVNQNYEKAYEELMDLDIKKDDQYFFHQVKLVMNVYRNYQSYQSLVQLGYYEDALDSLLNGVRMFDKYKDEGRDKYKCYDDMNLVLGWITTELNDVYQLNESQAREINLLGKGKEYSYQVATIAAEAKERDLEADDSNN